MVELKTICVAVDFTTAADAALRSAANLARAFGARLVVVTVVQPPSRYQRILSPVQASLAPVEEMKKNADEGLERLLSTPDLAPLVAAREVRVGAPFSEIIAAGRAYAADLLVIGAKKRGGVERLLLGGTAERVVRKSESPVLIARSSLPPLPRVVLAPTDFSAASRPAVRYAAGLARVLVARLILLHVVEPVAQTYVWPADPAAVDLFLAEPEDLEPEWETFLESVPLSDVRWEQRTFKGYAAATIVATAEDLGADLIVVGTHGRSGLMHTLLGSVVERVVRETTRPVLSVRPESFQFTLP